MKKCVVLILAMLFSLPAYSWTTVKYSAGGSFPMNSTPTASTHIVRYNIAGQPMNPTPAIRAAQVRVVKGGPASPSNSITVREPRYINAGSSLQSRRSMIEDIRKRNIGGAKPPRVASYCNGITYYKNGVPSCSRQ